MMTKRICHVVILAVALAMCLCWTSLAEATAGDEGIRALGTIGRIGNDAQSSGDEPADGAVEWSVRESGAAPAGTVGTKEWTFLVYICGSNLGMSAKADLMEMATSGFDEDLVNVVAYTGGAKSWGGAKIPTDVLTLHEVHSGVVEQVESFSLADMSISSTLNHFLNIATERYPAEKYALILWDHGGGPNGGLFIDMLYDQTPMAMDELEQAIEGSPFTDRKLDFIGFDACLMGSIEVAKVMEPYAEYMVASEESEPGLGWNYAFLGAIGKDSSMDEIARSIIDSYFESIQTNSPSQVGKNTMSCINLAKMADVEKSCEAFFKDMEALLDGESYVKFAKARDKATNFGDQRYDLIDIGSFIKRLDVGEQDSREKFLKVLDSAVIFNCSDTDEAVGLSVYHPYNRGGSFYQMEDKYSKLSPSEEYSKYIGRFTDYLTGKAQADYSGLSTLGRLKSADEAQRDMNTNFTLMLTEEQFDFMAEAELQVFESLDEGESFALVSVIPDVVSEEGNAISASYVHRALFIVRDGDDGTEVCSPALPYDVGGDGIYSVEATLVGTDADGNEVRCPVRLLFALNETEKYDGEMELQQIEALDENEGFYTTRHNIDLADYDRIEIVREVRRPTARDGASLDGYSQWDTVSSEVCELPLEDGWDLRMLHDVLDRRNIYVAFAIRDYQNYHYTSDPIALAGSRPDAVNLTYDDDYLSAYMPMPVLDTEGARPGMRFSLRVANHSEVEDALFQVANLRINGQPIDFTLDIYGNGPNEGLLIDEEQAASTIISGESLKGLGTVESIDFDLLMRDAAADDSEVHTVPVHGTLILDVSAFD